MSTNFPISLDDYGADLGNVTVDASYINNPADALEAIEAKIGIDKSAVETSLEYLIKDIAGGHNHDGVASKVIDDFRTGDWIISSVTTPRVGFSNVSATYADKFIRLNPTIDLSDGQGANVHTHGSAYTLANHTHGSSYSGNSHRHEGGTTSAVIEGAQGSNWGEAQQNVIPNTHTHSQGNTSYDGTGAVTGSSENAGSGAISGTSSEESNIPKYIRCTVFQKV